MAHIGSVSTVSERRVTKTPIVTALMLLILNSQAINRDLPPVINVFHLKYWSGEAFALTSTILLGERDAEIANARVVEVLSPSNVAHVPVIVFLLAIVASDKDLAVSAVFRLHPDRAHLPMLSVVPDDCELRSEYMASHLTKAPRHPGRSFWQDQGRP